jgi:hypothetical protein
VNTFLVSLGTTSVTHTVNTSWFTSSGVERQCQATSAEHRTYGAFAMLSYLDIKFVPYIYTALSILTNSMWFTYLKFNVYGYMHHKYVQIYIQQDATLHSLFISGNCSTCFGWYFHPSSGAHTTVTTASGICHTVTAICRYRGRSGTAELLCISKSSTIAADSSNGVTYQML